jgi:hypothetical protein
MEMAIKSSARKSRRKLKLAKPSVCAVVSRSSPANLGILATMTTTDLATEDRNTLAAIGLLLLERARPKGDYVVSDQESGSG